MIAHIIFIIAILLSFGILAWSVSKVFANIKMLKNTYPVRITAERIKMFIEVVFGQTKILRFPVAGIMHFFVFWGFGFILVGSFEMLLDGAVGVFFDGNPETDRVLSFLDPVYSFIIAGADIFALLILVFIIVFITRRLVLKVKDSRA